MSALEYLSSEQLTAKQSETAERQKGPGEHPLLDLQPKVGNQAIARLLQREMAPEEMAMAKHDGAIQREASGEEDEMAMAKHDGAIQREASGEEDEMAMAKHDGLQRESDVLAQGEVGLEGGPVSDAFASTLDSQRGGGSPLDDGLRSTMEGELGSSLGDVRVHTGPTSDTLNRSITAQAFTTGSDVFVRSDKYSPGSPDTNKLLAHELTHVVQQRSMSGDGGGMSVGAADTSHEREADEVAEAVTRKIDRSADEHDHEH